MVSHETENRNLKKWKIYMDTHSESDKIFITMSEYVWIEKVHEYLKIVSGQPDEEQSSKKSVKRKK